MPRVHHVKKARKADRDAGIKKGDSYYWYKFRFGAKIKSKTRPKPSQLTRSDFWSQVLGWNEQDPPTYDDFDDALDNLKSEVQTLRDEQEEKKSNMPDALQESEVGELLQERYNALDECINELDGITLDEVDEEEEKAEGESKEEAQVRIDQAKEEAVNNAWAEVESALGDISCS